MKTKIELKPFPSGQVRVGTPDGHYVNFPKWLSAQIISVGGALSPAEYEAALPYYRYVGREVMETPNNPESAGRFISVTMEYMARSEVKPTDGVQDED